MPAREQPSSNSLRSDAARSTNTYEVLELPGTSRTRQINPLIAADPAVASAEMIPVAIGCTAAGSVAIAIEDGSPYSRPKRKPVRSEA